MFGMVGLPALPVLSGKQATLRRQRAFSAHDQNGNFGMREDFCGLAAEQET
jgi:hypothetical protein